MNNLSTIPFYDNLGEQDHRLWYSYGEKFSLVVDYRYLTPFFHILPYTTNRSVVGVKFYKLCCTDREVTGRGDFNEDFNHDFLVFGHGDDAYNDSILANGMGVIHDSTNNVDIFYYLANHVNSLNMQDGLYYMAVYFTDGTIIYSEVFNARKNLNEYVKIEWYNTSDLKYDGGVIPYGQLPTFKNVVYISGEIGMPEYTFTEDGEERNGFFFPIKQISEKTYRMRFFAPEYLCDCMRLIRLSERVKVQDQTGKTYNCNTFSLDVNWLEQGHYANVECRFETDTVVVMVGKSYNNVIER